MRKDPGKVLNNRISFSPSAARADWLALNRRFNSTAAFRALVVLFVVTATVFSVRPPLRYLRGHSIFDYELWYANGKHVLAGDEIYFFRAGKYDFMYPPPCALFLAAATLLGQRGLIFFLSRLTRSLGFAARS